MDKQEIIHLIKQSAIKNGGNPPGKGRFSRETGVKDSDWLGKYWVRWSDLILDAGFEPKEMNQALEDNFLLENYIELIIELKHIPTSPELRMKARNCKNFPSHNTFAKFGNKQQLLGRVLDYYLKTRHDSIIIELLNNAISKKTIESNITEIGYVYLLQFGNDYKIGSSNSVERRFRELKTQMPYEGKIIHSITTGDPAGIEAYWHNYFSSKRLKGEWFQLSKSDIAYFKKRKLM